MPVRPWLSRMLAAHRYEQDRQALHATDVKARTTRDEAKASAVLYPPSRLEQRAAPVKPPTTTEETDGRRPL